MLYVKGGGVYLPAERVGVDGGVGGGGAGGEEGEEGAEDYREARSWRRSHTW